MSDNAFAALAHVSTRLSTGIGSDEVLHDVAGVLCRDWGLAGVRVWLRHRTGEGFRPVVSLGLDQPSADDERVLVNWLSQQSYRRSIAREDGFWTVLVTDGPPLGLLDVRFSGPPDEGTQYALDTIANMLSMWLAATELSEDLASEVAYRTRENESHRRFTSRIIDSLPVGLYVIDRNYRIQAWNRKRETGTQGIARDEALGRTVFDVLSRQSERLLREEFDAVFRTGRIEQMDVESKSSGQPRFYRISKIPMRMEDDEVTHVITIGEDVTEWKSIQHQIAQTEKLAAIGQLAAGVMHEINNPLATIGACVEALTVRTPDLPPADQQVLDEYLRIVDSELERCKAIVDGLLDFSHPKARTKQVESINQVVDDSLFLIKHHDRFRGIDLVRQLTEHLPPVFCNAKQLIQVFLAVMLNAIDSMDGQGTMTVSTTLSHDRKDEVLVEFSDTGLGIPREDLHKIFDPFFTTKATGRGTGLGLSICYGIVQEHGGRMNVSSQVGRGSSFRVYLPVAERAQGRVL